MKQNLLRCVSVLGLVALGASGCGARTSLREPARDASTDGDTLLTVLDASTDVARDATVDVVLDAGRPCRRDADCADRFACTLDRCNPMTRQCERVLDDLVCSPANTCNNRLRCVDGEGCQPAPPISCNDGVECTVDSCDLSTAMCRHTPDATRCPLSHGCDPATGCFARALAHNRSGLLDVRLPSGSVSFVVALPPGLTDIALRSDGTLFAVGGSLLHRLDINTGESLQQFPIAVGLTALEAAPDGSLYAAAQASVYKLDPPNFSPIEVARFPAGFQSSGDLAWINGELLATAQTIPTNLDTLFVIDAATRTARVRGPTGFACLWGLAAFGTTLYGFTCRGDVLLMDSQTGQSTLLNHFDQPFFGGTAR